MAAVAGRATSSHDKSGTSTKEDDEEEEEDRREYTHITPGQDPKRRR